MPLLCRSKLTASARRLLPVAPHQLTPRHFSLSNVLGPSKCAVKDDNNETTYHLRTSLEQTSTHRADPGRHCSKPTSLTGESEWRMGQVHLDLCLILVAALIRAAEDLIRSPARNEQ